MIANKYKKNNGLEKTSVDAKTGKKSLMRNNICVYFNIFP